MSRPRIQRPDLPEYMTWEELEQLPEEIAEQIELWDGRVVWLRRGPAEHQAFTFALTSAFKRCAREGMVGDPQQCWRVDFETNVFFGESGKSDFVTPDFLVYRCLDAPYQDIRASDVLLAGEVLSPSNTQTDMEAKKARYAKAGIPWYWEVTLEREKSAIAMVHAYALESTHGKLPEGVRPLHPANYLLTGNWSPKDSDAIVAEHPFPIRIPWSELEF
ncbi:Uma2 family endonuclease [Nocardia cyriacigeorgica]|uniref:Uma2 family endonuclease n=1 Tax=Nocardia cyriacigeorgica TaxID=135487 RepID=UPI001E432BA4|nr:Uma2 family endonuclease [Nocardia cyriacigeorgica]